MHACPQEASNGLPHPLPLFPFHVEPHAECTVGLRTSSRTGAPRHQDIAKFQLWCSVLGPPTGARRQARRATPNRVSCLVCQCWTSTDQRSAIAAAPSARSFACVVPPPSASPLPLLAPPSSCVSRLYPFIASCFAARSLPPPEVRCRKELKTGQRSALFHSFLAIRY